MKLNEKGLKRLLDVAFDGDEFYQSNALEVEFEPDDFDGCFQNGKDHIVLTVEEAKFVSQILPMSILWTLSLEQYEVIKELNNKIKERIEQVEKCERE